MHILIDPLGCQGVGRDLPFRIPQCHHIIYLKHQENILTMPFILTNPLPSSLIWPEEE